jgi:hypothetical protein
MFHFFSCMMTAAAVMWQGVVGAPTSTPTQMPPMHDERMGSSTNPMGHTGSSTQPMPHPMGFALPGVVTAISGTSITVVARLGDMGSTTFQIDASQAVVRKGTSTTTASIADIHVGDIIGVQGTVGIVPVVANTIVVGKMPPPSKPGMPMGDDKKPGMLNGGEHGVMMGSTSPSARPPKMQDKPQDKAPEPRS